MNYNISESFQKMLDKLSGWIDILIMNLPNLLVATLVVIISYILSQKSKLWVDKLLRKQIKQHSIRNLIASTTSVILFGIGLFLSLSILDLDQALTTLLTGAGVMGLAIGLALQGALSNTFSGIFLAVKDIMNVGDYVETNGYAGKVLNISMRYVKLLEVDNNVVIIPNKLVLDNPFKNYGLTSKMRVAVACGIAYESDLEEVEHIAKTAIIDTFSKTNHIEFYYLEFGDSAINFEIRFWIDAIANLTQLQAKSKAIVAIKEAFEKANINIPYPTTSVMIEKTYQSHPEYY